MHWCATSFLSLYVEWPIGGFTYWQSKVIWLKYTLLKIETDVRNNKQDNVWTYCYWDRNSLRDLGQYYDCWCTASLRTLGPLFTELGQLSSMEEVIICPVKCENEVLIHSQTSTDVPSKFKLAHILNIKVIRLAWKIAEIGGFSHYSINCIKISQKKAWKPPQLFCTDEIQVLRTIFLQFFKQFLLF